MRRGHEISKFESNSQYYVHFWIKTFVKAMNLFIPLPVIQEKNISIE